MTWRAASGGPHLEVMRNQGSVGRIVQCSSILGNVVLPFRMVGPNSFPHYKSNE